MKPAYHLDLTDEQVLDVIASIETMRDAIHGDLETRGRLTALLDNVAAQTGARKRDPDE